jgi:excisionase family DNA binding protein
MPNEKDELVTISEASRIMGVSEVTLRQWTDEGSIKAFVTPGGHRRYSKAELKKVLSLEHKPLGINDLAVKLGDSASVHREIAAAFLQSVSLYSRLDAESQKRFSSLGRQLLSLIIKYITEVSKQEETLLSIREVGHNFGELTAKLGLPLIDSVQAFTQHRDPIVSVTSHMLKKGDSFSRRLIEAIPLVDRAMDEALVSLVSAHQQQKRSPVNIS